MSDQSEQRDDGTLPATGPGPSPLTEPDAEETPARDFNAVLDHELEAVRQGRALRGHHHRETFPGHDSIARAHNARLSGFAVSGGGIRSATFNLGVIQAMARLGLLHRFDYLSVNSGGGYIGSWLAAWIRRQGIGQVEDALRQDACRNERGSSPANDAAAASSDPFEDAGTASTGQDVEAGPIRFLRRFSNYLTPKLGLFSADTWTLVATYLRNLILNFGVVILLLAVILLSPRLLLLLSRAFNRSDAYGLVNAAIAFLAMAIVSIGLNLAEIFPEKAHKWPKFAGQGWVQGLVVLPLFAAAWLAALWLWYTKAGAMAELSREVYGFRDLLLGRWLAERWGWYGGLGLGTPEFEIVAWVVLAALIYFGAWLAGCVLYLLSSALRQVERPPWAGRVWRAVLLSAPIAGATGGAMIYGLTAIAHGLEPLLAAQQWHLLHINVWKGPAIVLVFLLTGFLHTGLMGRAFPESLRQWWSRLGAWMLIYTITWIGLFGMAIYGPILLALAGQWAFATLTASWAGATAAGVVAGRHTARDERTNAPPGRMRKLIIAWAPQIFIVGLLALVSLGLHLILSPRLQPQANAAAANAYQTEGWAAETMAPDEPLSRECGFFWKSDTPQADAAASGVAAGGGETTSRRRIDAGQVVRCHSMRLWNGTTPGRTLVLLGLLAAGAVVFSWRVDINEFSMHLFYRNRLIRAYLGASNDERRAQPFTGFDPGDDLALADFTPAQGYDGPYPIHNVTLNLVAGKELAWQERKGASFVFTPLASGFEVHEGAETKSLEAHGFRPTVDYQQTEHGISVGTAVAISGAAASPNMGAATTPAMAFLLTVFNVRLGWWLGNPRHKKTWPRMGPHVGAAALLAELFGSTDETSRYVYLSDGGHFENLAVYELIRRRCRFILASDAGADPDSTFEDLANAIRKCCTDFGIEIDIDTERVIRDTESRHSVWHCAIGTIRYDKVDPGAAPGMLVYIKASLTGDEARDVLTYGVDKPTFPHESTADQFFGESQFESYRKLGEHVAMVVFQHADDAVDELSLEALMVRLAEAWYPPSGAPTGAFTRHAAELDRLLDRLRSDPHLRFLVHQMYPEWEALAHTTGEAERPQPQMWLPATYDELVGGFFFSHALIQLMENIYLDLNLEREFAHPDNRGWMNLFKHWTWSGMVRATWAVTASTFGARFQTFCRRRLGFIAGHLEIEEHALAEASAEQAVKALHADHRLNFLEEELVGGFLARNPGAAAPDRLFLVRMATYEPTAVGDGAAGLRFTCGFALARGNELCYIRIQDHLRKMGLGRRALRHLVEQHGIASLASLSTEQLPDYAHERPDEACIETLHELFHSVVEEHEAAG